MKKLLSMLLVLIMTASLFAGCAKDEAPASEESAGTGTTTEASNEKTDDKEEKDQVAEEEAVAMEPVELTLWVTSREQDDFGIMMEEKFKEAYPHITLNKVLKEGDPGNEFYQGVAAGNAPDMIEVSFTMMDKYIKGGILEPLNDYLASWEHADGVNKHYVDMFTADGNNYGLPRSISPMFFGYNKALFAENGLQRAPKTWEEAIEYAKIINDNDNQVNGYSTITAEWTEWYFQYYVWQAGGDLTKLNDDGTIELTFDDPAVIEAANYYKTLVDEGVLQSDLTLKFGDLIERFAAGKVGMMPFAGDWVSWAASLGMDPENIGLTIMPEGPAKSATAIAGSVAVINANTTDAKKDAAWAYMEFFSRPENIRADFENKESKGAVNPMIIPRDDLPLGDIVDMPEAYSKALLEVVQGGRLEFAGKAQVGIYVDRVVQKVLTDPNADPLKEFTAAQEMAQKEVIDQYNKDVLSK